MLITVARSIVRVVGDFFSTKMEELSRSVMLKNMVVCFLRTVFTRTYSTDNFCITLESNGHVLCVVPQVAMLFMGPWSIGRVVNDLFATEVEELSRSVILKYLGISKVRVVFSGSDSFRDLVLLSKCNFHVLGV